MNITPFFLELRSAYQAEIDDLTFDSEGRDVLRQRLADKRRAYDDNRRRNLLDSPIDTAREIWTQYFDQVLEAAGKKLT